MMNPLVLLVLFGINLLTSALALSVLMLALWQHPGDAVGRAVIQFLAAVSVYNLTVLIDTGGMILRVPPVLAMITTNLVIDGFALTILSTFALVITLAGMMKQALQLLARAAVVMLIVGQWQLWSGGFFVHTAPVEMMITYTSVGVVSAVTMLIVIFLTAALLWVYRRRIGRPLISVGLVLLLLAQAAMVFIPRLREVNFGSVVSVIISAILAVSLVRMQLFNPLVLQTAQLTAFRNISLVLTGPQNLDQLLVNIVQQARQALKADMALIFTQADATTLIISAQDGGSKFTLVGRHLPVGDSLSGRVFETQQAMRLSSYRDWDGRSPIFADVRPAASMGVPLIYDMQIVGVLTVLELEEGHLFSDRDEAILELLAPPAAVAIVNANLRQRLASLPTLAVTHA